MNSYNTIEEIRNYLIPLGFHEYKPTQFDKNYVVTCFQKRYDNEVGKKYFIDAKVIDFTFTDKVPMKFHLSYSCQLYQKDTHEAFNIEFIDWGIKEIEEFINKMFDNNMLDYYEYWD